MEMNEEFESITLASVAGTYVDFAHIDLSPWGILGGFAESEMVREKVQALALDSWQDKMWSTIKESAQQPRSGSGYYGDYETVNILWPNDLSNPPSTADYFEAIEAIRIAHPCEVHIRNSFDFQYDETISSMHTAFRHTMTTLG